MMFVFCLPGFLIVLRSSRINLCNKEILHTIDNRPGKLNKMESLASRHYSKAIIVLDYVHPAIMLKMI